MRKGLGKLMKSPVKETLFTGHHVVVDGGQFLYSGGEWMKNSTFGEICQTYVTVVFDGYDATSSSTNNKDEQKVVHQSLTYLMKT